MFPIDFNKSMIYGLKAVFESSEEQGFIQNVFNKLAIMEFTKV